MKFILFFAFLICVVAAFDFDLELITPATTKGKDEVFVSSTVETPAVVTTAPATTTATTATQAPQEPLGRAVSSSPKEEKIGQIQQTSSSNQTINEPQDDATTTTSTTTTTTTSTFINQPDVVVGESLKRDVVEVIINKSIYRLVDEALRERLINFESRIASLLHKRQIIETEIDNFIKTTDNFFYDDFFSNNLKETDR